MKQFFNVFPYYPFVVNHVQFMIGRTHRIRATFQPFINTERNILKYYTSIC